MRWRLFLGVGSLEARTSMSYRVDFWLQTIAEFAVQFGVVWFLWRAMFRESGATEIGGYSFHSIVVYYLAVILLGKLVRGRQFDSSVSDDIYMGGLNRYLVFPVRYLPFKYAQHIGKMLPALVQFALFGGIVVFLIDIPPEMRPTPASALMAFVAVALANLLYFVMSFPIQCVAFWAENVWSLEVAKRFLVTLLGGYMLPLEVFPRVLQDILWWLPFRLFFHFPARALMNQVPAGEWAASLLLGAVWTAVFGWIAWRVWRRGQFTYTGVGI
ncbi:MAG: ABC transporter permease [Planctomycetota bacterium]